MSAQPQRLRDCLQVAFDSFNSGRYDQALLQLLSVFASFDHPPLDLYVAIATCHFYRAEYDVCEEYINAVLRRNPSYSQALCFKVILSLPRALSLLSRNPSAGALIFREIVAMLRVAERTDKTGVANLLLANIYSMTGHYDKAWMACDQAAAAALHENTSTDVKSREMFAKLIRICQARLRHIGGEFQAAAADYVQPPFEGLLLGARADIAQGLLNQALELAQQVPDRTAIGEAADEARLCVGTIFVELGRYQEGLDSLGPMITAAVGSGKSTSLALSHYLAMSTAALRLGDLPQALVALRGAVELLESHDSVHPWGGYIYSNYAQVLLLQASSRTRLATATDAVRYFWRAIELLLGRTATPFKPSTARELILATPVTASLAGPLIGLAEALLLSGRAGVAVDIASHARSLPDAFTVHPRLPLILGACLTVTGKHDAAQDVYYDAISVGEAFLTQSTAGSGALDRVALMVARCSIARLLAAFHVGQLERVDSHLSDMATLLDIKGESLSPLFGDVSTAVRPLILGLLQSVSAMCTVYSVLVTKGAVLASHRAQSYGLARLEGRQEFSPVARLHRLAKRSMDSMPQSPIALYSGQMLVAYELYALTQKLVAGKRDAMKELLDEHRKAVVAGRAGAETLSIAAGSAKGAMAPLLNAGAGVLRWLCCEPGVAVDLFNRALNDQYNTLPALVERDVTHWRLGAAQDANNGDLVVIYATDCLRRNAHDVSAAYALSTGTITAGKELLDAAGQVWEGRLEVPEASIRRLSKAFSDAVHQDMSGVSDTEALNYVLQLSGDPACWTGPVTPFDIVTRVRAVEQRNQNYHLPPSEPEPCLVQSLDPALLALFPLTRMTINQLTQALGAVTIISRDGTLTSDDEIFNEFCQAIGSRAPIQLATLYSPDFAAYLASTRLSGQSAGTYQQLMTRVLLFIRRVAATEAAKVRASGIKGF